MTMKTRCESEVLRDGYYTGRRCSRLATMLVTVPNVVQKACCTQHGKAMVARNWHAQVVVDRIEGVR